MSSLSLTKENEIVVTDEIEQVRASWDTKARDWKSQVGDHGDWNRRLCSDPVLFELLGKVRHKSILDAGCGTGYLTQKLTSLGADAVGVDLSPKMIETARQHYTEIDFRVDDVSTLQTISDDEFDIVVSNYVLMDTPDLPAAINSIYRVLRPGGVAVVAFSHPCFPQTSASVQPDETISYHWKHSYFEQSKQIDAPWKHFQSEFIWYHRPLEDYWRQFRSSGFHVTEMREPRITPDRYHEVPNMQSLRTFQERPISVVFKLFKPRR